MEYLHFSIADGLPESYGKFLNNYIELCFDNDIIAHHNTIQGLLYLNVPTEIITLIIKQLPKHTESDRFFFDYGTKLGYFLVQSIRLKITPLTGYEAQKYPDYKPEHLYKIYDVCYIEEMEWFTNRAYSDDGDYAVYDTYSGKIIKDMRLDGEDFFTPDLSDALEDCVNYNRQ